MRTKSINDLYRQADRIRAGYGWKALRDKWDYDRYMAIVTKTEDIRARYTRNIGRYQREAEGWTKEEQARQFHTVADMQYPREVYAGY